jgi:hypothetical protein
VALSTSGWDSARRGSGDIGSELFSGPGSGEAGTAANLSESDTVRNRGGGRVADAGWSDPLRCRPGPLLRRESESSITWMPCDEDRR